MNKKDIQKFIGIANLSVLDAMKRIDENSGGILFLVDADQKLIGCITDGDIRRFLLSGGQLDKPALDAANREPKTAKTEKEAQVLYHKKNFIVIPIVDENGTIINLYTGDGTKEIKYEELNIPVIINAGGKGTRLDPFTRVLPKPLIPVGELPIIEHIVKRYQLFGCNEYHIIVNYKKQLIKAYFNESDNKYNVHWYDEEKPLGTGGGLSLLKGKINSTFFFATCDTLMQSNYDSMLRFHRENKNVITMVCAYKNITIPYGIIEMGANGSIKEMREKPELSFLTNTGMYIVEPEVLDDIEDDVAVGFPDIIEKQRQKGKNVAIYPVSENEWMDMGQLSELEKMRERLYGE